MENGRPIAKVKGGKYNGKIIFVEPDENKKVKNKFDELELTDGEFIPLPNYKSNRNVMYVAGASGSGKSFYTKQYIKSLLEKKPDLPVYLFSPFDEDESLDDIEPQRIKIDMDLVEDPIDPKELRDSIVIFDDIDSIELKNKKESKQVKEAIRTLLNQCLEIGRHFNITTIMTNHILCAGNETKKILNEAHSITFFPNSGSKATMKRLSEQYGGIDEDTLKKIKKLKTRWATIHRNYPIIVSTQKKVFNPNKDD
jgi:hypothetical protein